MTKPPYGWRIAAHPVDPEEVARQLSAGATLANLARRYGAAPTLEPDAGERRTVALILALADAGEGYHGTARRLNAAGKRLRSGMPWTAVQVSRICKNRARYE